jgi:hypothetical protein
MAMLKGGVSSFITAISSRDDALLPWPLVRVDVCRPIGRGEVMTAVQALIATKV